MCIGDTFMEERGNHDREKDIRLTGVFRGSVSKAD